MKPQEVRLLDVLAIGPLMIYGGAELRRRHPVAGTLLALSGVATVLYNGKNFLEARAAPPPPAGDVPSAWNW